MTPARNGYALTTELMATSFTLDFVSPSVSQAGVADLSAAQAVQGGWGLAMLGDKDGAAALLGAAAAAVQKVGRWLCCRVYA